MKNSVGYLHSLPKVALLFIVMNAFWVEPAAAQNDLQILVTGPWSYVRDQTNYPNRLVLVAPAKNSQGHASHHQVYSWSGTDVTANPSSVSSKVTLQPGIYTLDFDPSLKGMPISQGAKPTLCGASVTNAGNVDAGAVGASNYVISLPIPDAYSTYIDPNGTYSGTSYSQVSANDITPINPATETQYTTLMALHYGVKSLPPSLTLNGPSLGGPVQLQTVDSTGKFSGGVSILAADPNLTDDDPWCDDISRQSIQERNSLWKITEYARFPRFLLDSLGNYHQWPGHYDFSCSDSPSSSSSLKEKKKVKHAGRRVILPNRSGGSADCHACQMSIINNGAPGVPGAIIKP
jgi:hypothetical protein